MKTKRIFILCLCLSLFSFIGCDFLLDASKEIFSYDDYTVLTTYEKQTCDWLIIMYVDGDNNLQSSLYEDINEIEKALATYNNSYENRPNVKIVALWDGINDFSGPKSTHIFEFGPDYYNKSTLCSNTKDLTAIPYYDGEDWLKYNQYTQEAELNMGDVKTLENFLCWVNEYYQAEHTILQFSNHGGGPRSVISTNRALCTDDSSSTYNNLAMLYSKDVSDALAAAGYGTSNKLDMLIFDVCFGASLEDAYQYRNYADYMLASANEVPGYGLDYTKILDNIREDNAKDIGIGIVDDFKDFYEKYPEEWNTNKYGDLAKYYNKTTQTLSLIDLSKVEAVAEKIDALASAISQTQIIVTKENGNEILLKDFLQVYISNKEYSDVIKVFYKGTFSYLHDIGFLTTNIRDLCAELLDTTESDTTKQELNNLKESASNVITSLQDAIIYTWRKGPENPDEGFIGFNESEGKDVSNSLYYGKSLPYGLTISGSDWLKENNTEIQFSITNYEDFLDISEDYPNWYELLKYYFEEAEIKYN